jgi:hypothetical protein
MTVRGGRRELMSGRKIVEDNFCSFYNLLLSSLIFLKTLWLIMYLKLNK